jgi:hypothetical protein
MHQVYFTYFFINFFLQKIQQDFCRFCLISSQSLRGLVAVFTASKVRTVLLKTVILAFESREAVQRPLYHIVHILCTLCSEQLEAFQGTSNS